MHHLLGSNETGKDRMHNNADPPPVSLRNGQVRGQGRTEKFLRAAEKTLNEGECIEKNAESLGWRDRRTYV